MNKLAAFRINGVLVGFVALWMLPSTAMAQERLVPTGGTEEVFSDWMVGSPTRTISRVAAELFWRSSEYFGRRGNDTPLEPTPLSTPADLSSQAYAELERLQELKRPLTAVDTQPFWAAAHQLYQSGFEAREGVLALYRKLGEYEVCLADRLEISRFVGQDHMFRQRFTEAAEFFQAAEVAFEAASNAEKKSHASTMANILYLRGMLLTRLDDSEQGVQNDIELATNPLFAPHIEPVTRLTILERIGDQSAKQSKFDTAQGYYRKAVDLLMTLGSQEDQLEHHVRVAMKELLARANAEKLEKKKLRECLRSLRPKFENKDYVGFEQILQAIVVADNELEDKEAMIADLGTLRVWYFKHLKLDHKESIIEQNWRDDLVAASKLLVITLYEKNEKAKAREVIKETEENVKLEEGWKQGLPRELLQSSVMEREK